MMGVNRVNDRIIVIKLVGVCYQLFQFQHLSVACFGHGDGNPGCWREVYLE